MSVKEIETAISQLSSEERALIHVWLDQFETEAHLREEAEREERLRAVIRKGEQEMGPLRGNRPSGLAKGLFTIPDDFDTAFSEEIVRMFEGE